MTLYQNQEDLFNKALIVWIKINETKYLLVRQNPLRQKGISSGQSEFDLHFSG